MTKSLPDKPVLAGPPAGVRSGQNGVNRRFSVAPMMDWTDRHCRYFLRLISARALLYTEMVTSAAVIHGKREKLIGFNPAEQPVALQLGGSDHDELARAARIGEKFGYAEINFNVGCPSDRVRSGRFGACLMAEPHLVAECVVAMKDAVDLPVTVKCRTGIDELDSDGELERFVSTVADAGCATFIIHARKAWLEGLSPKQNRDVPELDYARVYRLKQAHPELEVCINGGIATLDEAEAHLARVDGVMLGRAAYHNPFLLAEVDVRIFSEPAIAPTREQVLERYIAYAARELQRGARLHHLTRHVLGLYHGQPGARAFRRYLTEEAARHDAGIGVLKECLARIGNARMDAA
ncbi:MAG: tRNA dihydrouridine(20/20a) synthase DusA [Methyloligellaceae bacterium]